MPYKHFRGDLCTLFFFFNSHLYLPYLCPRKQSYSKLPLLSSVPSSLRSINSSKAIYALCSSFPPPFFICLISAPDSKIILGYHCYLMFVAVLSLLPGSALRTLNWRFGHAIFLSQLHSLSTLSLPQKAKLF